VTLKLNIPREFDLQGRRLVSLTPTQVFENEDPRIATVTNLQVTRDALTRYTDFIVETNKTYGNASGKQRSIHADSYTCQRTAHIEPETTGKHTQPQNH
jgi:hypothetical protein